MKKAILYSLESAIAITMILFIIVILFQKPPSQPEFYRINYKIKAFNGLKTLALTGELRKHVMENDVVSIENKLSSYIPESLNYTVVIFNENTNITEMPSITGEKEVVSVNYLLAGDIDDYRPKDVRIYLWGFY